MSVLTRIWDGETETRRQVLIISAIVVVSGIVLVVIDTAADLGWLKFPGAILITIGAAAGGTTLGFSRAARERVWARLTGWRVWIAVIAAVIIATPSIIAMASAAFGPLSGGGDAQDTALVVLGAVIGFILMVGTFLAGVLAVQATQKRVTPVVRGDVEGEDPT